MVVSRQVVDAEGRPRLTVAQRGRALVINRIPSVRGGRVQPSDGVSVAVLGYVAYRGPVSAQIDRSIAEGAAGVRL